MQNLSCLPPHLKPSKKLFVVFFFLAFSPSGFTGQGRQRTLLNWWRLNPFFHSTICQGDLKKSAPAREIKFYSADALPAVTTIDRFQLNARVDQLIESDRLRPSTPDSELPAEVPALKDVSGFIYGLSETSLTLRAALDRAFCASFDFVLFEEAENPEIAFKMSDKIKRAFKLLGLSHLSFIARPALKNAVMETVALAELSYLKQGADLSQWTDSLYSPLTEVFTSNDPATLKEQFLHQVIRLRPFGRDDGESLLATLHEMQHLEAQEESLRTLLALGVVIEQSSLKQVLSANFFRHAQQYLLSLDERAWNLYAENLLKTSLLTEERTTRIPMSSRIPK